MKEFTKENIKVGSVWHWHIEQRILVKIISVTSFEVSFIYIQDPFVKVDQNIHSWQVAGFRHFWLPVYTVEGFEV